MIAAAKPATVPEPGTKGRQQNGIVDDEPQLVPLRLASGNGPITRYIKAIPPRDARPDEIPIIDVADIFSPDLEKRRAVAKQVHAAAINTGFFYIRNHGVPPATTTAAYEACLDFFRQDMEPKLRAHDAKSQNFNGYKPHKTQRINPFEGIDYREAFSTSYDPRLDPAHGGSVEGKNSTEVMDSVPAHVKQFFRTEADGPTGHAEDRFPWSAIKESCPQFPPAIIGYWQACLKVARALVRTFALSLDLEETYFDGKFLYPDATLALNYYPPLPASANATSCSPDTVGIGTHTDFMLFTMLWQDAAGGLQVLNREGQWIIARPVEGTIVVNIADFLQRITNDRYQSTVHRAVNNSGRERVSIPFFFGFSLDESCGVLDSCVGADGVRKYDEISCEDWIKRRMLEMFDTTPAEGEGKQ